MTIAASRADWGALTRYPDGHPKEGQPIVIPQDTVVKTELAFHHSADDNHPASFWTPEREKEWMRNIQRFHIMEKHYSDFAYNWATFPTGRSYTGRGFGGLPAGQILENSGTWAHVFVGTFTDHEPTDAARLKGREFIERLLEFSDHHLVELGGHREFPGQTTECPGDALIAYVKRCRERYSLRVPRN